MLIDCGRTGISKMMPLDKQHTCSTCTQSMATSFAPKIKLEIRPTLSKCKKGIYMYLFEKLYIKNRIKKYMIGFNMKSKGKTPLI